ncbi:MAG TPA: hypothetical protein VGJ20_45290 [Xanthobacteraceae bacterium]|jgi:hypothetical protein
MAIINVTRWTGKLAEGMPIAREAATNVKQHSRVSVRMGNCYGGPHVGQAYTANTFTDWASVGRAQQALAADGNFQSLYAKALKVVELQERSLLVTENL